MSLILTSEKFRLRPATLDDIEAATELMNICSMHDTGAEESTEELVRSEWQSPGFDPGESIRIVESSDQKMVGYIEIWDTAVVPARIWVWGRVHPMYRGQGIGTQLMDWVEARARQALKRVPEDTRVVMHVGTITTNQQAKELFSTRDMRLVRHFFSMKIDMETEPPQPQWPPGITLRHFVPGKDERAVFQADRDMFQDHWGHIEQPFEEEFERFQHFINSDTDLDPSLWFLAMDGDQIVGFSLCELKSDEDPEMGWVNDLGVVRHWRRRGLALALLQHSFGELWRRGQRKVGLGVDASNLTGALSLYKKAGMYPYRQFDVYEKELRPGKNLMRQSIDE